jgi:aminoglycoside phosphotransferase family enzyme
MTKFAYPDYHRTLLDAATHQDATRRVRCDVTHRSLLYRTGTHVYKIRRTSHTYSSLAIKEALAHEALKLGRRWAPGATQEVVPITGADGAYFLGGAGAPVDYALRLAQLADHSFVDYLVAHGKFNSAVMGRVARFLAARHAEETVEDPLTEEAGKPETFATLVEEILYQSKQYFGVALNAAMFELISRPVTHFLDHHRKEFARRQKRKRIVRVHGAFIPEHVFVKGQQVEAVAAQESPRKLRVLDAASDVAQFVNGLARLGAGESGTVFLKRYMTAAKDRDLPPILAAYQVLHAARDGLLLSEWLGEGPLEAEPAAEIRKRAEQCYAQAVEVAHTLPK